MSESTNDGLTVERVSVKKLKLYPGNPRRGDVERIAESLETHGQYRPIVVQKSTSYVLAGNHTLRAARDLGWEEIEVVKIAVSDDEAKRIVLADNRLGDIAIYDQPALAELLSSLDGDLSGTGFLPAEAERVLAEYDAPAISDPTTTDLFMEPQHRCPSCGYEWNGSRNPSGRSSSEDDEA